MKIRITLHDGTVRTFNNVRDAREFLGELRAAQERLHNEAEARATKIEAGEDIELWPDETRDELANAEADFDAALAAIEDAERLEQSRARAALLRQMDTTSNRDRRVADDDGQDAEDRQIRVPAQVRSAAGRLQSFRGERALEDAYTAGMWILGVLGGNQRCAQWCREHLPPENRALSGDAISTGGALVPSAMGSRVIDLVEEYGVALPNCEVVTMTTEQIDWPRVTSGVTFYAIGDNTEITESQPGFDAVSLVARKWGVLVKYPSELSEDAVVSIADLITRKVAWGWAKKLDECLFLGDGTSTYHGIKGIKNALADGSEVTAATGNTAFSTLDLADFEAMVGKIQQRAVGGAKWYISRPGYAASMARLLHAAGGNTVDNLGQGAQLQFLGFPVVLSQVMNSTLTAQTSTEGLAYLGNLMDGVMVGLRRDLRMMISRERYMEYDQIGFVATVRHDINVHDVGEASTAGGIIGLETPGS
jgi:HK97 family phage major capsid protein